MSRIQRLRPQPPLKGPEKGQKINKREQLRNERANIVCQELRYQIACNDLDLNRLCDLVIKWKDVALRSQMKRPEINK